MKQTLLLLLIGLTAYTAYGQSQDLNVIASQGDYTKYTGGSISWTLGETFIETNSVNGNTLTQGFQQTGLTYKPLANNTQLSIEMTVYPNPTPGIIYLKTEEFKNLRYQLIDITGKTIKENDVHSNIVIIDMSDLPTSIYILRVMQEQSMLKSYQIIKE